jgi:hypothetical protein
VTRYTYTQRGQGAAIILFFAFGFMALVMAVASTVEKDPWILWVIVVSLAVLFVNIGIMCSRLRIQVENDEIRWAFGGGFPSYALRLSDVESVHMVRNSNVTGYGVRLIPGGVLYNVGGRHAVEIERRDKRRIRIATDDPEGLLVAIGHAHRTAPR